MKHITHGDTKIPIHNDRRDRIETRTPDEILAQAERNAHIRAKFQRQERHYLAELKLRVDKLETDMQAMSKMLTAALTEVDTLKARG